MVDLIASSVRELTSFSSRRSSRRSHRRCRRCVVVAATSIAAVLVSAVLLVRATAPP
jgi:hypothetical protein